MIPHLVFDPSFADSYRRAGYVLTEIRPGVWEVVNPRDKWAGEKQKGGK